jgi:hypothetical protein
MDGPQLEDISGEDFVQALYLADVYHWINDDVVIYVGF